MKFFRVVMSVTSKSNDSDTKHLEDFISYKIDNGNLTVTEIDVLCRERDNKVKT